MATLKAFYSDRFVLPLPCGHSFPMAKYSRLRARLVSDGILSTRELVEPQAASWRDLRRVHTGEYVRAVRDGRLSREAQRRIGFPWSPAMVERVRRSVAGTIGAAVAALEEGVAVNLAGGTHHAFAERGEGYCVFNDVAVAARALLPAGRIRRAAVVDGDVHQGNGTAAIFRDDPTVFTFSIHGENNFPSRKESSDQDVALPDGTGDAEYLERLREALREVFDHQQPELVFYVAGADAYEGDRWGRLRLSMNGLRRRDAMVLGACAEGGAAVAVSMAGGYADDVEAVVEIHAHTVREAKRSWLAEAGRGAAEAAAPCGSTPPPGRAVTALR